MAERIKRQSITIIPSDRRDTLSLSRNLQTTIDKVNEVIGVNGVKTPIRLSRLEEVQEPAIASFGQATERLTELSKGAKQTERTQADLLDRIDNTDSVVEQLVTESSFVNLPSTDFDNTAWGTFQGLTYGSELGSALSNPPTGVTLNAGATYQIFGEVFYIGAYLETIQLIGNAQNRVFRRAGSDFTNALANGWKEL